MEISHSNIGEKVCKVSNSGNKYGGNTQTGSMTCGAGHSSATGAQANGALKEFRQDVLEVEGYKHWPIVQGGNDKDVNNAAKVAEGLAKLTTGEKTIVAGLLAKTIEGGEVIEIRAVSSTFTKT
ncbi:hypothetical protein ANAPH2_00944 [Anaplasma phagocytophilum]|nr:hypothetical protein ANAPH2_00944 [Anaplasma phagocytophilum]